MSFSSPNTSSLIRNCPDYDGLSSFTTSPISSCSETNTENCISTPNSKTSTSQFTNSPISPFYSSYMSSIPSGTESNTEIQSFLKSFNSRFNVEVLNLSEVLDVVTEITRKNVSNKTKNIKKVIEPNPKTLDEINSLTLQNADLKSKLTEAEHNNVELNVQIASLQDKINAIQAQNESFRSSILSMQEMYEAQIVEKQTLSDQRYHLISIVNQQASIINALDSMASATKAKETAKKFSSEFNYPAPQTTNNSEDELYSCLVTSYKLLDNERIDNIKEIEEIKDNLQLSVKERIILIVKKLSNKINELNSEKQSIADKINELSENNNLLNEKCIRILSLFEEQLRFLQKLTHSTDLQNVVFYQESNGTSLYLSEENKTELIRKCAALGSFVEDTIVDLTTQQLEEVINIRDKTEQKKIFELINPENIEVVMRDALNCVKSGKEIDVREIFDILCAQIFINYLLKNYAKEISFTASRRKREIDMLQQSNRNEDFERELIILQKREAKIRKFLFNFIDADEDTPTFKLLKMVFIEIQNELLNQQSSNNEESYYEITESSSMEPSVKGRPKKQFRSSSSSSSAPSSKLESKKNFSSSSSSHCSSLQRKIDELTYGINEANRELQEKTEMNQKMTDELQDLRKQLAEVKLEVEKKDSMIIESNTKISSAENEKKENLVKLNLSETKCKELTKIIENNEKTVQVFKKQRKSIAKKMNQLDKCNIELRNQNERIKNEAQKQILEYNQKHQSQIDSLQAQLQNVIHEAEEKNEKLRNNESTISKLNNEITNITLENKKLEIKVKALEQNKGIPIPNIQQINTLPAANDLQKEKEAVFARLCNLNTTGNAPTSILSAVECVEKTFNNLKNQAVIYVDLIEEIEEAKKLLGIGPNDKLIDAINDILANSKSQISSNTSEKQWQQAQEEILNIKESLRNSQDKLVTLKKWENWARRIYSVIFDSEARRMTSDSIRMALDEALLSSVSHRSIFMKIDSLRNQKQMLLKYERMLLTSKANKNQSFRASIILVCAARKMMKLSGCLPIAPNLQIMRETPKKPIIPQISDEYPRSAKRHRREKSSKKPVIPLYV